ncbi:MAG: phage terminase small subunit P27 family [Candidatus Omnitrophota bacterium]
MRGRKPIPSNIHLLQGGKRKTHRKKDYRSGEPKPPANIPRCPQHLDKEARQEWRRMVKELKPLGILTNLDKAVFARYCQAFSTWAQATRKISEMGMVRMTKNGFTEQNPYFPIANKASEQMMKALIEMGMTPSSRSRVKVEKPKPAEPGEEFLKECRK